MTKDNLIFRLKNELGWNQNKIAAFFEKTPGTISAYRQGKAEIPSPMSKAIHILLEKKQEKSPV